jgi:hypothetical protein
LPAKMAPPLLGRSAAISGLNPAPKRPIHGGGKQVVWGGGGGLAGWTEPAAPCGSGYPE